MQSSKPTQGAGDVSGHRVIYLDWNEVNEPGVYVDTQYPRFFRVTKEGIIPGASPAIHGSDFAVARISSNPMLSKAQIQLICANHNLPVPE